MEEKFESLINTCEDIFCKKSSEYGPVWAIYRWGSFVDQLWIKVKRIRNIEEGTHQVPEPVEVEYIALINYAIIFLMRLKNPDVFLTSDSIMEDISILDSFSDELLQRLYRDTALESFELCKAKNHDYGNAWRDLELASITDLIITKVLRLRNIVKSNRNIKLSEVDQQLYDIINYSILALIKIEV